MTGCNDDIYTPARNLSFSVNNNTDSITLTEDDIAKLPDVEVSDDETESENDEPSLADKTQDTSDIESSLTESDDEDINAYRSYISFDFTSELDGPVYFYDSSAIIKDYGTDTDILQYVGAYNKGDEVEGL